MVVATSYRINCPPFAHQTIDGEVVLVNLVTGHYYSLRGCGAEIWTLVESGAGLDEIASALTNRYQAGPGEIAAGVARLLAELQLEGMLSPQPMTAPVGTAKAGVLVGNSPAADTSPFVPPVLEKFTDMQDLILLDPIHEVDEAGWPVVKNAA
ncbi:hypothetical protein AYO44_03610 [Planctomycetaceae bacterium SCGC AG-212-F19]|nr:hypothetical protein AYO44_03610 [Planctomycetaceae bacterium SCGC AG-212-F19]